MDERVYYQLDGLPNTQATRRGLGDLVLSKTVRFADAFQPAMGTWSTILELSPMDADLVEMKLKPATMSYKSPTYFDNGTLRPVYDSPLDELADRPNDAYRRWHERNYNGDVADDGILHDWLAEQEFSRGFIREKVIDAIDDERSYQDSKWGLQQHEDMVWAAILTEEMGEICDVILKKKFSSHEADLDHKLRDELIQVAAVAIAWLEIAFGDQKYWLGEMKYCRWKNGSGGV